jgi:hemerythrin superfamily protein
MVVVKRKANFCTVIGGRKFYPGNNVLTDKSYEEMEEKHAFSSEIECDNMEVVSCKQETDSGEKEGGVSDDEKVVEQIRGMNVKEASEIVNDILDIRVLRKIQENDTRKGIQDTVSNVIEKLTDHREKEQS